MEITDELIPLTEKDIEALKKHQYTGTWGCAVICFILIAISGFVGYQFFLNSNFFLQMRDYKDF